MKKIFMSLAFIVFLAMMGYVAWVVFLGSKPPQVPPKPEKPCQLSDLVPYKNAEGLWGFSNAQGEVIIPCLYEGTYLHPEVSPLLWVRNRKEWYGYDLAGNLQSEGAYSSLLFYPANERHPAHIQGLIQGRKSNTYLLSPAGKLIIRKAQYDLKHYGSYVLTSLDYGSTRRRTVEMWYRLYKPNGEVWGEAQRDIQALRDLNDEVSLFWVRAKQEGRYRLWHPDLGHIAEVEVGENQASKAYTFRGLVCVELDNGESVVLNTQGREILRFSKQGHELFLHADFIILRQGRNNYTAYNLQGQSQALQVLSTENSMLWAWLSLDGGKHYYALVYNQSLVSAYALPAAFCQQNPQIFGVEEPWIIQGDKQGLWSPTEGQFLIPMQYERIVYVGPAWSSHFNSVLGGVAANPQQGYYWLWDGQKAELYEPRSKAKRPLAWEAAWLPSLKTNHLPQLSGRSINSSLQSLGEGLLYVYNERGEARVYDLGEQRFWPEISQRAVLLNAEEGIFGFYSKEGALAVRQIKSGQNRLLTQFATEYAPQRPVYAWPSGDMLLNINLSTDVLAQPLYRLVDIRGQKTADLGEQINLRAHPRLGLIADMGKTPLKPNGAPVALNLQAWQSAYFLGDYWLNFSPMTALEEAHLEPMFFNAEGKPFSD